MKHLYHKYKQHYKSNLNLAVPVMISQLGHTLTHTADSIIVGHFAGTVPLAAVSLVNSMVTIVLMIGIGISYGQTPLIAQENGRNGFAECGKLLVNSTLINCITGLILFAVIYFGLLLAIDHLHQAPEVIVHAKPYLMLLAVSIIPLMVFNTFKQFAEGLGFTKQAMVISIIGNVINILLGITFVKGLFGIDPMGVKGVGLSTLIDRTLMALVMGAYVLKSQHFKKYLADARLKVSWKRIQNLLQIGGPVALQYTFEVSAFGGAAIIIGIIGVSDQAAHQVAIAMASMTYMMASGISAAAAIQTGNNFGMRNFKELRLSAISNYHIVFAFMAGTAVLFIALHQYLPWIYTSDSKVVLIASQLLIIAGFFQLFDGAQVVGLGILRGMGDVNIPTWCTFIAYWIIGLPLGYYLGIVLKIGATGIWYGLTAGLLISAILLFIRFHILSKRYQEPEK